MAGKLKIKHVQLEPAAFLSDEDFQMMDAEERGIYCTVIFYMLCNNGRIKNDLDGIKRLCNVTSDFKPKWDRVKSKFYPKRDWLRHRRVDFELREAKKRLQTAIKAGLKGAGKRWGGYNDPNGNPVTNENETKSKRNLNNTSNPKGKSHLASNSFRFATALEKLIRPRNQSDRTAFRNLTNWLSSQIINKNFNEEIYDRILGYAKEASASARNPPAMFFATLKRELGYDKKRMREKEK